MSSSRVLELDEPDDHDDHERDCGADATTRARGSGGPYLVKVYFQPWSARQAPIALRARVTGAGVGLQRRIAALVAVAVAPDVDIVDGRAARRRDVV